MKNSPLVSIVVPTYNRKLMVERLIKSLINNTYKNIEIIVIDDFSKDSTSEYLKAKFAKNNNIKVFRNKKNLFAAASKNVGQEKASGELIAFIDDDNFTDRKMIESLVNVFVNHADVGEAGPVNYNYSKRNLILLSRSTRNMWTTKTHHVRSLKPFKSLEMWRTDDIPNAFMVRADVIKKNKIRFVEKYGIMYEESDYAYKISRAGFRIVIIKAAKIYHDIEDNLSKNDRKDFLYHFMHDKRRPFVFARNRVLFHSTYSSTVQNFFILTFWIWLFSFYYSYKLLFYKGYGKFSTADRIVASLNYIRGTLSGLGYAIFKTYQI